MRLATSFLAFALIGCAPEAEVRLGTSAQAISTSNRVTANRITANRITANRVTANRIAADRIAADRLSVNMLDAGELLSTADGREVFTYLVSCALPADVTLEATIDGVVTEFPGSIGLAPDWTDRALKGSEKRWISACMIARVNAYDVSVSISIRGEHPALTASPEEIATYDLEEGAFYGNIFLPEDQPIEWVACRGAAEAAGEGEVGDLENRACTEPAGEGLTVCGFTFAGDCVDYAPATPQPHACERKEDGHYEDCHTVPGFDDWPDGTERKEVITVFVKGT